MCLFLLYLSLHTLLCCLFSACVIIRVLVWISCKCMVSCRVVIIPAHQVLSPCVANLPSLSLERPRVEGMTQQFRTNETRLQDLQQTVILSPSEERLLKLQSRQFKFATFSRWIWWCCCQPGRGWHRAWCMAPIIPDGGAGGDH